MLGHSQDVASAISAPRVHLEEGVLHLEPPLDAGKVPWELVRWRDRNLFFGGAAAVETLPDGSRRGVNTHVYTTPEIRRVARVGFELARLRQGRVTSVEKANVMEA